jgi:two-component system phosphate regulon sensor histidine kinase PhoR
LPALALSNSLLFYLRSMKSSSVRWVVALGVVSIIGIITIQIYWVQKAFYNEDRQFSQTLFIALKNVAAKMANYNQTELPDQSPVSQLSSNYYVVNVNSVIDANVLEYYLKNEFGRLNIHADYEYAIYDCTSDRMMYGDYVSALEQQKPTQKANLPKWNQYTYYFGLYLPNKTNYLVSKLEIWMLSSVILLVVILFFGYALFVILRQKQLSEIQKDFINNMTHEFKTPISTIAISAEVIARPDSWQNPQRLSNYAAIIREENSRLNKQVEKVLQIAKIEQDEFRLQLETLDLHELIRQVIRNYDLPGKNHEGHIETHLEATQPWICADQLHLTNILFNLLDNAVKYAEKAPVIRFSTCNQGNRLLLSIADNGIGISRVHQKRVFDKFFRVPSGDVHNVKGFGLGLYYVRNIVVAHQWKITLESEPNGSSRPQGSIFTLSIPIKLSTVHGKK